MYGWANFYIGSFAIGGGYSFGTMELGDTWTTSIDMQVGIDLSAMWFGGYGRLLSYQAIPCYE